MEASGRIDRQSPVPFYFQLAAMLEHEITGGRWQAGAQIPSEPDLCTAFGVSRSVVRQAFQALVSREDIHNRLGEVKAPALVIHGTADAAIDIEKAQRLCSDLADCEQFVAVEGGGHACNLTHPEPVNLAILQFLGDLDLKPARSERLASARRADIERRSGERRNPTHTGAGYQVFVPVDRRMAERRSH